MGIIMAAIKIREGLKPGYKYNVKIKKTKFWEDVDDYWFLSILLSTLFVDIKKWMEENNIDYCHSSEHWDQDNIIFCFKKKEDSTLFKLTWG